VQAGCDSQRTFQSAFGAVALGSGAVTVWQSNGLLSSSLSIDSRNRLYSATQGDLPQACQVDSVRGVVSWCTKLLPAQSGSVQVTVAQAGVVEWADVSVWLSDIGKLYGLRLADGNVSWSVTLPNFPTKHAVAAPLLLDPVAKFAPVNLTGVVVAHGSTLMRVQVQTGAVVWQTDLCTLVTGGGMSPCYSATAGATLIDVGTPALAKPIVLVPVVDAVLGYALVGVHARTGLLALHAPLPIGGTVFDVLTAPPLAVARKNLTLVAANAKTALYAINTTLSAPSASRIVWQGPPFALRFGVTLLGADVVFACGFGLCVARAADGQSVLASDNLMCVNDVGPFECAAQSPPLNVNGMLLVGAGVNQKSWSALNALDSRGRLLWTYSGVSGKRLQNLRTPVVGSDGTIFINDALGSIHALRVVNVSAPTSSPTPQSTEQTTLSYTPAHTASPQSPEPFPGALLLVAVVASAMALFGLATLLAMCLLSNRVARLRDRAGFERLS
jgi:outer membrane protein assembly factor BamB